MISNSGSDERGKYHGGQAGDQTGGEWKIRNWYNSSWKCVLRYPDSKVANLFVDMATKAANNNNIGYDQWQRTTFWLQLKNVNYEPDKITTPCEADCSAGVVAIVKGAGCRLGIKKLSDLPETLYTGNMRQYLINAGFQCLTDSKYLTSDDYLLPGDILLNDSRHTAFNLTKGSKVQDNDTGVKTVNITLKVLCKGMKDEQVKTVQRLLREINIKGANGKILTVDGDFGLNTETAIKSFQKANRLPQDGIVGEKTWGMLLRGF